MSRTTIKAVWLYDRVEDLEEFGNSWGWAPVVWGQLSMRYLGWEGGTWLMCGVDPEMGQLLCGIGSRTDIPDAHAALMRLTYDRAIVLSRDFGRAAGHIGQFLRDFPLAPNAVNHWPRIQEILLASPESPAIGFHGTSITEDPFEPPVDWNSLVNVYS